MLLEQFFPIDFSDSEDCRNILKYQHGIDIPSANDMGYTNNLSEDISKIYQKALLLTQITPWYQTNPFNAKQDNFQTFEKKECLYLLLKCHIFLNLSKLNDRKTCYINDLVRKYSNYKANESFNYSREYNHDFFSYKFSHFLKPFILTTPKADTSNDSAKKQPANEMQTTTDNSNEKNTVQKNNKETSYIYTLLDLGPYNFIPFQIIENSGYSSLLHLSTLPAHKIIKTTESTLLNTLLSKDYLFEKDETKKNNTNTKEQAPINPRAQEKSEWYNQEHPFDKLEELEYGIGIGWVYIPNDTLQGIFHDVSDDFQCLIKKPGKEFEKWEDLDQKIVIEAIQKRIFHICTDFKKEIKVDLNSNNIDVFHPQLIWCELMTEYLKKMFSKFYNWKLIRLKDTKTITSEEIIHLTEKQLSDYQKYYYQAYEDQDYGKEIELLEIILLSEYNMPVITICNLLHNPIVNALSENEELLFSSISEAQSYIANLLFLISLLPNAFVKNDFLHFLQVYRNSLSTSSYCTDTGKALYHNLYTYTQKYISTYYPRLETCFYLLLEDYVKHINANIEKIIITNLESLDYEDLLYNEQLFSSNPNQKLSNGELIDNLYKIYLHNLTSQNHTSVAHYYSKLNLFELLSDCGNHYAENALELINNHLLKDFNFF